MSDEPIKIDRASKEAKEFKKKIESIYIKPSKTSVRSSVRNLPNGDTKEKFYETKEYKGGATKRHLIGIKKNNSKLWGREK